MWEFKVFGFWGLGFRVQEVFIRVLISVQEVFIRVLRSRASGSRTTPFGERVAEATRRRVL